MSSNIYGITLKSEGKIYYFNGEDIEALKDLIPEES